MRKYLAEITGTFILTFTVILSLAGAAPMATPVAAALAVGIGVYMFGSVSGAHFNPAITLGVLAVRKISVQDAVLYITSQLIGAGIATILARTIVQMPELTISNDPDVMMMELIGTFILALGVAAAVHGKVSQGASGLTVGGSLLIGIIVAAAGSNGVLNPAVALGIGSLSYAYLLGPVVGSALGMALYSNLHKN